MRYLVLILTILFFTQTGFAGTSNKILGSSFSDGSPSCTACHSIAAAGYIDSTWGPDISSFIEDMGDDPEAIIDFIKESGIAPMDAAYAKSEFTEAEITALIAAFSKLDTEEVKALDQYSIVMYALLVFIILLAVGRVIFRNNSSLEENK